MSLAVNIADAVLEKTDLETGLHEVFASVAYAVLGCDSAYLYISCVEQFQNLSERLAGIVDTFIT